MLMAVEQVRRGLLHSDRDVRDAVANFFALGCGPDADAMSLVAQCVDELSWHEAFSSYDFLSALVQSDATLDWMMQRLPRLRSSRSGLAEHVQAAVKQTIIKADTHLLTRRLTDTLSLPGLGDEACQTILERIEFASLPPDELWRRLESICRDNFDEAGLSYDALTRACRVLEGLGQYPECCSQRIFQILCGRAVYYWPMDLAVRLAGEIRLEAAVPRLLDIFDEGGWPDEECVQSLASIGTDEVVDHCARQFASVDSSRQARISCLLGGIYTQRSVSTRLGLVERTSNPLSKSILLRSALQHFATESLEPARRFVFESEFDCNVPEVRRSLLPACKLMESRFPEFDGWEEQSQDDEIYRCLKRPQELSLQLN